MKVIYIHQYYQEKQGATRSYHFSRKLREEGHDVSILTGLDKTRTRQDGVQIVSTQTKYSQKMTFMQRIIAFAHFVLCSIFYGLKEKKPDVILASSTPLTVGIIGVVLSKLKRCPFVFEVRDVWPDIPIELGIIRKKWLVALLKILERWIYKHAAHIIVLSEPMKQNLLQKKIPAHKVTVIENLADIRLAQQMEQQDLNNPELEHFLKTHFVVAHPGTMGLVNGVHYFAEIAEEAAQHGIAFLLIGDGSEKKQLMETICEQQLTNIKVLNMRSKEEIYRILHHVDIGALTVIDCPILWDNSANKFFDYLAIGLPVVLNYQGWQHQALTNFQAGKGFLHHDKAGLIHYLKTLKNDTKLYQKQRENAKLLGQKYSVNSQFRKFLMVLEESS
ncbi:glycosyltransferase family 4 protein [Listeria rocourtiae]|uniref:glycosyltransferase family 4 protein n=1 Tax=Listeria rocourtiae TaxID=647910 RepID=UPI003D2F6FEA